MEPKVMNLLQVLVDNAGTVVSRADLLNQVWSENAGGDESLSRAVSLLRRAFGEIRGGNQYIETVPKRGYRLVAEVCVNVGEQTVETGADKIVSNAMASPLEVSATHGLAKPPGGDGWTKYRLASPGKLALVGATLSAALLFYLLGNDLQTLPIKTTAFETSTAYSNSTPIAQASVAVLPFEDLSIEGDQQYFADGLAEEILNALVQFPELRVMGRKSSFAFRGSERDIGEIHSALAVSHLLTGSLRKQGSRVRITARLLQAEDGSNVWSESYDGDISDIFDLQEKIARQITENLGLVLDLSSGERYVPKLTNNRLAYDLFLQGRALSRQFGHRNKTKAKELLGQAVSLDPNFAAAWAWLGQANLYLGLTASSSEIPDLVATARDSVNRALSLDPELAMGHYVQTILLDYDLDFAGSLDSIEKAYALNPYQPFLAIRRGNYHSTIGRSEYAATLMEQGLLWDPTDSIGLLNLSTAHQSIGNLDRAIALLKASNDLGFEPAAAQRCTILKSQNQPQQAHDCWINLPDSYRHRYSPLFQDQQHWLMLGRALTLDDAQARRQATEMLDHYFNEPGSRANTYIMLVYLTLGGPERFMKTFVSHPYPLNSGMIGTIWDDSETHRKLRQHPKFPAFAERLGLVHAWQKYGWPDRCQPHKNTDGSNGQFSCD